MQRLLFFIPMSPTQLEAAATTSSGSVSFFAALGVSLIAIFFTYGGYQNTANLGGDVKSPQKTIPRSILTAIGIIFLLL